MKHGYEVTLITMSDEDMTNTAFAHLARKPRRLIRRPTAKRLSVVADHDPGSKPLRPPVLNRRQDQPARHLVDRRSVKGGAGPNQKLQVAQRRLPAFKFEDLVYDDLDVARGSCRNTSNRHIRDQITIDVAPRSVRHEGLGLYLSPSIELPSLRRQIPRLFLLTFFIVADQE